MAWRDDETHIAHRQIAYRLTQMTAIRFEWPVAACGRMLSATVA